MSPTKSASSRSFGLLLAIVFFGVAALKYWNGTAFYAWALTGVLFLAVALIIPRQLRPLKRLWLAVGNVLGRILSPVALTLVYILSFVPVGLLLKIFGKDSLNLRHDPHSKSYWIRREPPGPAPDSLKHQF